MGYYSALKRNDIVPSAEMWIDPGTVIQSEVREKQISCISTYMWNLEKWYRLSYLQSRNRDTDVENKHMNIKWGEGRWGELELTYIHCTVVLVVKNLPASAGT